MFMWLHVGILVKLEPLGYQGRIQEIAHPGASESLILAPWSKVEECHPPPVNFAPLKLLSWSPTYA